MVLLIDLGISRDNAPREAAAFQALGGRWIDLQAIAQHYRSKPGAWTAGAVVVRMRRWAVGQNPEQGWPPPAADWEQKRSRAESLRRHQARQAERSGREAAAHQNRANTAELAARWAGLSSTEREQLLDDQMPGWRRTRLPGGSASAIYASVLLEAASCES